MALALVDVDLAQGKLESARSHLESALQLDANDAETHERLGDVLVEMRLYRDAINAYETARQIDANSDAVAMKQPMRFTSKSRRKAAIRRLHFERHNARSTI